jgi:hypothetical protein
MKFEQLPEQAQKVVAQMADHLATQRKVSGKPGYSCLYRSPNGCKCAVGLLIPDELYTPYIEDVDIQAIMDTEAGVCRDISDHLHSLMPGLPTNQVMEVLSGAQIYHDRSKTIFNLPSYSTDLENYKDFEHKDLARILRNGIAANISAEEF